jgi:hypothetical protein
VIAVLDSVVAAACGVLMLGDRVFSVSLGHELPPGADAPSGPARCSH